MKSLILFDASSDQAPVCRIAGSLADALSDQGDTVTRINVREKTIACCTGCFGCWFKTPGECVVHDDGREIARELIGSDRVVIVSPVQFGSISSAMKRAVERQIPGISPLFQKWRGEWHHKDRYPSFPDFAVIGWLDSPDADAGKVFHNLFFRNQMNFRSHHSAVRVVHGDEKLDPVSFIEEWMDSSPGTGRPEPLQTLSDTLIREVPDADTVSPGHLLCLMGSPARDRSTSARLAETVAASFPPDSWEIRFRHAYAAPMKPADPEQLTADVLWADRMVLAFPLYVDGLPSGLLEILEGITARLPEQIDPRRRIPMMGICNCGFPESHQCDAAMDICAVFARDAGLYWQGGLSIGMGGMIHGRPLNDHGGPTRRLYRACRDAGNRLKHGKPLTADIRREASKPMIPYWIYALIAGISMRRAFKPDGPGKRIDARPFEYPRKS